MSRADRYSSKSLKPIIYKDFLINFDRDPITGELLVNSNEDAVKQEIQNVTRTIIGERFYSDLGSKLNSLLFENNDSTNTDIIREIQNSIKNYCPRVYDINVDVAENTVDDNVLMVSVFFKIINIQKEVSFNMLLKRVR